MYRIAYYRVSTGDQSIEAQRTAMGGGFDQEFSDEGVSGGTLAASRPGFTDLLAKVRKGDTIHVYAVDRLGRDALDVETTIRELAAKGVTIHVHGLGPIGGEPGTIGALLLTLLAQVAAIERRRISERTAAGREAARASLAATGKTHRGKESLGRPKALEASQVAAWRRENAASINQTARHFNVSAATVKRYCGAT